MEPRIHRRTVQRLYQEWEWLNAHHYPGLLKVQNMVRTLRDEPGFLCEPLWFYDYTQEQHPARRTLSSWLIFAVGVLNNLSYVHDVMGLIHNDPKPCNIGFRDDLDRCVSSEMCWWPTPVLIDFDFATPIGHFSSPSQQETSENRVISCTPTFCSPEQALRKRVYPSSDVFVAATTFVSIVTGHEGFRDGNNPISAFAKVEGDAIPRWQLFCDIIGDLRITLAISKALKKKPENRFQTAREFAKALWKVYVSLSPQERSRSLASP